MRKMLLLGTLLVLTGPCFGAEKGSSPSQIPIFPLSEIKAGMKGVAYTVFEGWTPEPIPVEVVGVLKNVWGPRQDIILVRVGGRAEKSGVAAGMSGSPVYIDGKWVGAISLRIGAFPTDPIAGVTPAEYMIGIEEMDKSKPVTAPVTAAYNKNENASASDALMAAVSELLPHPLPTFASGTSSITPIETPLLFSGFSQPVMDFVAPLFQKMGMVAVSGGSDSRPGPMPGPEELAKALLPGSAVSALLLTGDLSMAGTGTVTYNDGRRILAFGHPFFGLGPVDMPISKAEVLTTLGSSYYPFKIANTSDIVGSLVQDRQSGIMGVLGKPAHMIPVSATLHVAGQSVTRHYEVLQNQQWTPIVMLIALYETLSSNQWTTPDSSLKLRGSIDVKGYPSIQLDSLSTSLPGSGVPAGFTVAMWMAQKFNQLYQNRFEMPQIGDVHVDVDVIPEIRTENIESVWSAASDVHPGDEVAVKVFLKPYRGERVVRETTVKIPENTAKGSLRILFSDGESVNQNPALEASQKPRATSLPDLITMMNRDKSSEDLCITLFESAPTAYYDDKLLPSIPSTIANVMESVQATSRMMLLGETAISQSSIPMDAMITGSQMLVLTVD